MCTGSSIRTSLGWRLSCVHDVVHVQDSIALAKDRVEQDEVHALDSIVCKPASAAPQQWSLPGRTKHCIVLDVSNSPEFPPTPWFRQDITGTASLSGKGRTTQ